MTFNKYFWILSGVIVIAIGLTYPDATILAAAKDKAQQTAIDLVDDYFGEPGYILATITIFLAYFRVRVPIRLAKDAATKEKANYKTQQMLLGTMLSAEIDSLGKFANKMIEGLTQDRIPQIMPEQPIYKNQLSNFAQLSNPLTRKIVRFYARLDIAEQDRVIAQERFSADRFTPGDLDYFRRYKDRMIGIRKDTTKIRDAIDAFYVMTYGHGVRVDVDADEMENNPEPTIT